MAFKNVLQPRLFDDVAVTRRDVPRPPICSNPREFPAPAGWVVDQPPTFNGEKHIILNAETTGLQWWGGDKPIGWAYRFPESGREGYLPMRHAAGNLPVEQVHRWLGDIRVMHVTNANTKFDLHMAREDGVDLAEQNNTFGDVAHHAALLDDNRRRFNLDQLSKDILGWDVNAATDPLGPLPKGVAHEGEWHKLPSWEVAPYALRNVEQVAQLLEELQPDIEDENLDAVLQLEQDIIPVVVEMEKNGTFLDMPLLEQWRKDSSAELEARLYNIYKTTGLLISSPDSPKDLEALFNKCGIPLTHTDTGRASFTDSVLKAAKHPAIADLRVAGQLADLNSKYLDKYWNAARSDGWLRFNLHQLKSSRGEEDSVGTVSGRFSGAGDKYGGYNPQQVVAVEKQLERGWCPDYVVRKLFLQNFAADMMQVEYRLFAHYAKMHEAFHARPERKLINGKWTWIKGPLADFHALVAELLVPINPALNRKLVKNINFAMIYGAGLVKFAFMLGLITEAQYKEFTERLSRHDWSVFNEPGLAQAKLLRETYMRMFPAVKPLLEKAAKLAEERGYVMDFLGRRARLAGRFHSSLNRVIQGGAATYNKMVLVELYKLRRYLGLTLRLTVHDEVCGDLADPRTVGNVKRVLNRQYWNFSVPILWDAKTGANWAACK